MFKDYNGGSYLRVVPKVSKYEYNQLKFITAMQPEDGMVIHNSRH